MANHLNVHGRWSADGCSEDESLMASDIGYCLYLRFSAGAHHQRSCYRECQCCEESSVHVIFLSDLPNVSGEAAVSRRLTALFAALA